MVSFTELYLLLNRVCKAQKTSSVRLLWPYVVNTKHVSCGTSYHEGQIYDSIASAFYVKSVCYLYQTD